MKARVLLSLSSLILLLLSCGSNNNASSQISGDSFSSNPSEATSIGPSYPTLDAYQQKYSLSVAGNEVTLTKYLATSERIVNIPQYLDDNGHLLKVVSIWDECFQNTGIISVTLPSSITTLGKACFAQTSLASITLPESVTSIGDYAFYRCSKLSLVELHEGLESIGIGAFSSCTSLRSFTIPDSVTSIGRSVFKGCSALKALTLPFVGGSKMTNAYLSYLYGALDNAHSTDVVESALKEVTITKENVPAFGFYHLTHIEKVTLESLISAIGSHAFDGCTSLTTVIGLDHVASIGIDAFKDCPAQVS